MLRLLAVLLFSVSAFAQFDASAVLGTVRDKADAVVAGATVTIKSRGTGIALTTRTDGEGNYQFLNVRVGDYEISASQPGSM